jgi:MarR family transcriptional regulator, 2-MHQ and catechol-resistance regulon repressor
MRTIVEATYKRPAYLATLRELVRCTQAFERYSVAHVRQLGLTAAQFDVVATLGNTEGMTCGELGEKTLITKGTLTGVLDRLSERGLIERLEDANDARRTHIALTSQGEAVFAKCFPAHLAYLQRAFDRVAPAELNAMRGALATLRAAFEKDMFK